MAAAFDQGFCDGVADALVIPPLLVSLVSVGIEGTRWYLKIRL